MGLQIGFWREMFWGDISELMVFSKIGARVGIRKHNLELNLCGRSAGAQVENRGWASLAALTAFGHKPPVVQPCGARYVEKDQPLVEIVSPLRSTGLSSMINLGSCLRSLLMSVPLSSGHFDAGAACTAACGSPETCPCPAKCILAPGAGGVIPLLRFPIGLGLAVARHGFGPLGVLRPIPVLR